MHDLNAVRNAARKAVAKVGPEYAYRAVGNDTCAYTPSDANPYGCIVNAVLNMLEPDLAAWLRNWHDVDRIADAIVDYDVPEVLEPPALVWLEAIQTAQDLRIWVDTGFKLEYEGRTYPERFPLPDRLQGITWHRLVEIELSELVDS